MNKTQNSRTAMFSTVGDYMEQNRPIWEGIKAINDTMVDLRENTGLIMDTIRHQTVPTQAATDEKDQVRRQLEATILHMGNQLSVLAANTHESRLAGESQLSPSILGAMALNALDVTGERIHSLVVANLPALADFGVTPEDAAAMATLVKRFRETKTVSRRAINNRTSETTTLPALIRETSNLLRHRLDKLMKQFGDTHPKFYAGYLSARVVIHRGRSARKEQPISATAPQAALETATSA